MNKQPTEASIAEEVVAVPVPMSPTGFPSTVILSDTTATETNTQRSSAALTDSTEEETNPEIEEARARIEETRSNLTETIDAIKDRLSPANIMAEVKESAQAATMEAAHDLRDAAVEKAGDIVGAVVETAKDAASTASDVFHNATDYVVEKTAPAIENAKQQLAPAVDAAKSIGVTAKGAGETIVDIIRNNPVPTALIALGIGWLLAAPRRTPSLGKAYRETYNRDHNVIDGDLLGKPESYAMEGNGNGGLKETVQNATETVKDTVTDLASGTREKALDLASNARNQAGKIADATREKTQDTVSFIDHWVHEEPLAAGAIALLVGAAVGLSLPGTDRENLWFGAKRDELAQKATQTAQEMADKVQNVAGNVIDSAKDAIGTATNQAKSDIVDEARSQGLVTAS